MYTQRYLILGQTVVRKDTYLWTQVEGHSFVYLSTPILFPISSFPILSVPVTRQHLPQYSISVEVAFMSIPLLYHQDILYTYVFKAPYCGVVYFLWLFYNTGPNRLCLLLPAQLTCIQSSVSRCLIFQLRVKTSPLIDFSSTSSTAKLFLLSVLLDTQTFFNVTLITISHISR